MTLHLLSLLQFIHSEYELSKVACQSTKDDTSEPEAGLSAVLLSLQILAPCSHFIPANLSLPQFPGTEPLSQPHPHLGIFLSMGNVEHKGEAGESQEFMNGECFWGPLCVIHKQGVIQ